MNSEPTSSPANEIRRILRFATNHLYSWWFGTIECWFQRQRLKGYETDVRRIHEFRSFHNSATCLLVFHEPSGRVPPDIARLIRVLEQRECDRVIVMNHEPSNAQYSFFAEHATQLIVRGNQGQDFGAFKDAIALLDKRAVKPIRLLLLNDSVYFSSVGLDAFVSGMLGAEDVICAHENWAEGHHLQSFALSISASVAEHPAFTDFWRGYLPIRSRLHAIENGEKRFSAVLIELADHVKVLYSASQLRLVMQASERSAIDDLSKIPIRWRTSLAPILNTDRLPPNETTRRISDIVNESSTIHSGAYLFPKLLNSPLFKKDLVFRDRFHFHDIEHWGPEVLPPVELKAYLATLRRKQDPKSMKWFERRRHRVGAR